MESITELGANLFARPQNIALIAGLLLFLLGLVAIPHSIRWKVWRAPMLSVRAFNEKWIERNKSKGSVGYKYQNQAGCYVFTVYPHRITAKIRYMHYKEVYVGQSEHLYLRIRNHANARGNGKIYGSIMAYSDANVFVKWFPCKKKEMNQLERKLIAYFHAETSFNNTAGGGKIRTTNR